MVKKEKVRIIKKVVRTETKPALERPSAIDLVIENSVALQKVVTELAISMKKMSKDIAEMLELFKDAARAISAEKTEEEVKKHDISDLKSKVDELIEQNKIIAKGILLLESSITPREAHYS